MAWVNINNPIGSKCNILIYNPQDNQKTDVQIFFCRRYTKWFPYRKCLKLYTNKNRKFMENRNFHTWKVVSQQVSCPPRARLPARNGLVNEVDIFMFIFQRLIRLRNRWLLRWSPFEYLCLFTIGFSASPTNSNWVTRPYNPRERVGSVNETFNCLLSQSHVVLPYLVMWLPDQLYTANDQVQG